MRKALFGILLAATAAMPVAAQEAAEEISSHDGRAAEAVEPQFERRSERHSVLQSSGAEERALRQQQRMERRQERMERQQVQHQTHGGDAHHNAGVGAAENRARLRDHSRARLERWLGRDRGQGVATAEHGHANQGAGHGHANGGNEHRELHRDYRREHRELHRSNPTRREHREFHREVNRDHREAHRETHQDLHRDYRREHRELHRSNPTRREHRRFHREANRDHGRYHRQWDRGWRNDRRYDWQSYRYFNRPLFSPGYYYSPYRGHRYSRFSIGVSLRPDFYSSRYWINDPWVYRLPQPFPGTRWIRYYDDVLLVDVYTGEVVDVIYNFFW